MAVGTRGQNIVVRYVNPVPIGGGRVGSNVLTGLTYVSDKIWVDDILPPGSDGHAYLEAIVSQLKLVEMWNVSSRLLDNKS